MRWLDGITNSMDMILSKLQVLVMVKPGCCSPWFHKKSDMTETELIIQIIRSYFIFHIILPAFTKCIFLPITCQASFDNSIMRRNVSCQFMVSRLFLYRNISKRFDPLSWPDLPFLKLSYIFGKKLSLTQRDKKIYLHRAYISP